MMKKQHVKKPRMIQSRFLIVCLCISLLSLLLLAVVSFYGSYCMVVRRTSEEIAVNLEMASDLLDIQAREIETVSRNILSDSVITRYLKEGSGDPDSLYADAEIAQGITSELKRITINEPYIASIYLFNQNGAGILYRRSSQTATVVLNLSGSESENWYTRTIEADGYEQYFLRNVMMPRAEGESLYSVSTSKLLRDLETNDPFGFLVVNVNADHYSNVFPATKGSAGGYALTDPREMTVEYISSQDEMAGEIREVILHDVKETGNDSQYLIASVKNQRTGWILYHVAKKSYYIEDLKMVLFAVLAGLVVLSALSWLLSYLGARAITRPLSLLGQAIGTVRDIGYPPQNLAFGDDEVGLIGQQFLSMFNQTRELTEKVTALTVLQREAELQSLQAQINPHFLYNSLSAIYWLSKGGRTEDAAQMSIALSELFKAMISQKEDDSVTVAEELHYIDRYLYIQNIRFNGRINVTMEIDESLQEERILQLLLQPIVENAVTHGLEPKIGDWKLAITGTRRQQDIIFTISDNGVGIDLAKEDWQGYAIRNVIRRIWLRYGDSYGCYFASSPGEGTTVTVHIHTWEKV